MKILTILLTAFYSLFAAFGIASVVLGRGSPYLLIVVGFYLATAAALNHKGGKPVRIIANLVVGIFLLCGLLSVVMFVSTFFGHAFDSITPVLFAVFGVIGGLTLYVLRKQKVPLLQKAQADLC